MKKSLKYIGYIAAFISSTIAFGQHKGFDTIEYRVVQQANANIANGAKLNSNPAIADTTKPSRKVEYTTIGTQYQTTYTPPTIQAIQLKGEPLDKLEHSALNIGGGNYGTLYAEYFFNSIRSRDWDYGIHLNHFSSDYTTAGYGLSNFNFNDVNLYVTRYFQYHTLTAYANYDEHMVHDYGYDTAKFKLSNDVTKEQYNLIDGGLQYTSHYKDSTKINHDIKLGYYNFSDMYGTTENSFSLNAHVSGFLQKQKIDIKFLAQYYSDMDRSSSSNAVDLGLNPYVEGGGKHWDVHIGLKAYLDAIDGGTTILPDLLARYHVADDAVIIYAGIDGEREYNSYRSLTTMNPFLQDTVQKLYTVTPYRVFAGFTGNITNQLTYDINGSEEEVKNMPLFITDTLELLQNRFTVVYDNVQVINAHADIAYRMREDVRFTLSGDWYKYTTTNQLEAWYHPTLKINLLGEYVIQKKFTVKADIFFVNSQYAPEIEHIEPVVPAAKGIIIAKTLSGYTDLNLGLDYKYSKLITAFVTLNNLANIAYYQWDNYPTQRFNFLLGGRLTF